MQDCVEVVSFWWILLKARPSGCVIARLEFLNATLTQLLPKGGNGGKDTIPAAGTS